MVSRDSSHSARNASLILRSMVRSLVRNRFFASCWVIEEPPCAHAAGLGVGDERAHRAGDVDAEMLVEAPVLGRERRLDQRIGELRQRDRIVVLDAAAADLVAVAVEERHRELGLLQPVVVGGLAERRAAPAPASRRGRRRRCVAPSDNGSTNTQRRQPPTWKRSMNMENRSQTSRDQRPVWNRKLSKRASKSSRKRLSLRLPGLVLRIGIELAQCRLVAEKPRPRPRGQGFTFAVNF